MRLFIALVWLMIWSTPAMVAIMSDSIVLILIAMFWVLVMKLFTDAYMPRWLLDEINKLSRP